MFLKEVWKTLMLIFSYLSRTKRCHIFWIEIPGSPHPTALTEGPGLACVIPPPVIEKLDSRLLNARANDRDLLSQPQVEAATYAIQAHHQFFKDERVDVNKLFPLITVRRGKKRRRSSINEDVENDGLEDGVSERERRLSDQVGVDCSDTEMGENEDESSPEDSKSKLQKLDAEAIGFFGPVHEKETIYRKGFLLADGTGNFMSVASIVA